MDRARAATQMIGLNDKVESGFDASQEGVTAPNLGALVSAATKKEALEDFSDYDPEEY